MSHPSARAERRRCRRLTITRAIRLGAIMHWFLTVGPDDPAPTPRKRGGWAKTGPYNWHRRVERDYFYSGVIRRDVRAGGGRRPNAYGKHHRLTPAFDWRHAVCDGFVTDTASTAD